MSIVENNSPVQNTRQSNNDYWNAWAEWSPCSVTCGAGVITRSRWCRSPYGSCEGEDFEEEKCQLSACPTWNYQYYWGSNNRDTWGEWDSWSSCSVTCGEGLLTRRRLCSGQTGSCEGDDVELQMCQRSSCLGTWSQWSSRDLCTCGRGYIQRTRTCSTGVGNCEGDSQITVSCNDQLCTTTPSRSMPAANPQWNSWGAWSECSSTCGSGFKNRIRTCPAGRNACEGGSMRSGQGQQCENLPRCRSELFSIQIQTVNT